jgi:hypothetical protein
MPIELSPKFALTWQKRNTVISAAFSKMNAVASAVNEGAVKSRKVGG